MLSIIKILLTLTLLLISGCRNNVFGYMRSGGIRKQTERVATVTPTVAGEARESATPRFLIYNVIGCPSFGININNLNK